MVKTVERIREQKVNYTEIALKTIFLTAVLSVAVMAPNALKMFDYLKPKDEFQTRYRLKEKTNKLIKSGYVKETKSGLELTKKGENELLKFPDFQFKKPKKWDGTWTVISFDFSEKKRKIRNIVRDYLKNIGFEQLQESVWVFPYDCPELIYLIKVEWNLKDEIVYIRTKYISRDQKLRSQFGL